MKSVTRKAKMTDGYKQTKLGLIPVEWKVKSIREIGKVITGNTPPTNDQSNYGKEYLFVSPFDLGKGKYIINTEKKLSKKGFGKSRILPKGSVLFTCIGSTIGKIGIALSDITSNQQINTVVCNEEHSNEFLYYELNRLVPKIRLIAGEQAVPIINKTQFESVEVISPPLPEQQKIAHILSTWDKATEKTEQLIAQKQQLKKGLMQQLLYGQGQVQGVC